ncbi:hypothetical protein GALMADRAFT_236138 [Galerina marginata CBS 339.88]|uniref:SEC7 domain-containing protein n=1 Tax=Galerina marginata (strain CBS 339.88) TaxID=685588 RepID=A0A067TXK6_GALM3|nr:hypothetical protein GALMADRAFT_236138 [Galerina marginata CBS 339.88]
MEDDKTLQLDSIPHSDSNASSSYSNPPSANEAQEPEVDSEKAVSIAEDKLQEIQHFYPTNGAQSGEETSEPTVTAVHRNGCATEGDNESTSAPPIPPKVEPQVEEKFTHRASTSGSKLSDTPTDYRQDFRVQSPSLSLENTSGSVNAHKRSMTILKGHNVSMVLITTALETIASSKEARRSAPLRESTQRALELIRSNQGGDRPREIFEPLRLACETRNEKLMVASLDCISKLISYSFFNEDDVGSYSLPSPPPSPQPAGRNAAAGASQSAIPLPSLVDLVAHTITSCHTETTLDAVSLQIVKALLSLVLSPTILVHHSSLLKAVRTVYNIFLLSTDPVNQMVAQGGLTQMVHHVFTRCRPGDMHASLETSMSQADLASQLSSNRETFAVSVTQQDNHSSNEHSVIAPMEDGSANNTSRNGSDSLGREVADDRPPLSLQSFETQTLHDSFHEGGHSIHHLTLDDLFVKDAFLVFRALCKLTMKPLNTESERDLKSHGMRSRLLSLQLVLTVLNSHMPLFVDPSAIIYSSSNNEATSFVQAINQYLCLCLSRNAVSSVPQVFEISVEIFWRVLSGMRTKLKKEIEVLLHEIFIPILEMRTSTLKQKAVILGMLSRLCQDPQALVELYLNYDCDSEAADNIYEHLMNIISKFGSSSSSGNPQRAPEPPSPALSPTPKAQGSSHISWNVSGLSVPGTMDTSTMGLSEGQLRRQGLECLVSVLRSLVAWGTATTKGAEEGAPLLSARSQTEETKRDPVTPEVNLEKLSVSGGSVETFRQATPDHADDPTKFESAKQKKTTLLEGIKKFNYKPKRGIQFLLETGFISDNTPQDIAVFLLTTDGLNKSMIGEYLGEGDDDHVAIMHAFVDHLDFRDLPFVDALRLFLQSFRLPGEAQKIDRFMLKFAERYIAGNTKTPFASAESAYVLAYSVIMLNTDAHNPQIKKRMTRADFLKNNRGINEGDDLPEEFLSQIFDEIVNNEIRMKDEVEAGLSISPPGPGLANAFASVGRDLQKEAYVMQSNGMANKTEALFRTMMRTQRKGSKGGDQFFSASHFVHVRPMFEVAWIPFLAGLSGPLQDTDDLEVVELCLDGFKNAIRIVCFFDLELQRNAFVTTLAKFTFLNNLGEMKTKNMEAIKALLDVAVTEGNNLKGSWHEVLTCVSQLEHMQLISNGVEVVDTGKKGRSRKVPTEELANESRSTHITVAADMVFSLSHFLSGIAIVDFVQALCDVSWEEIQSSGLSQHPRLFSLQKLVDISYYNMTRIRLEWSNLWDILGEHFNLVCCHNNPHVASFALDSLRQLAMRFLEKEELPHFKFQKDFLKPFEYTMVHNQNPDIRDLVLQCLQQMIQARAQNMRSGWRTMFGVFSAASKVLTERVASSAFEIVTRLNKDHFNAIVQYGAFADLTVCITEFCKVSKYQKISLLAIAMLRGVIPVMLQSSECSLKVDNDNPDQMDDSMIKYWFPVLFGFYDIIMNGEDLEVRRLALDSLFSTLKTYGATYPVEFWDTVCQELLFPIFAVLKSSQDLSRFSTQEDMSVWLSTTMIQALRDLIDLYTFYFDILERFLDGLLDLLCVCICQENDTLARIGTSCLQQLLENNVAKLSPTRWERVTTTFVRLFRTTTPYQLFDESLRVEIDSSSEVVDATIESNGVTILPAPLSPNNESPKPDTRTSLADRRRIFKQIIVKCVLQLLLIETTNDLLRNNDIYNTIPPTQLLRMMSVLDQSYQFARSFNEDKDLRTGLWKVGFMKHLPNLLKQESSSAATLVHVLLRMYHDMRPEHQSARPQIAERLVPLGVGVLRDFNKLKADSQSKNILAWTPVVAEILEGYCRFDRQDFTQYLSVVYPLATELLSREIAPEVRQPLKSYFERVGYVKRIVDIES